MLGEYGCDQAQGYYVAGPSPAAELGTSLRTTGRRARTA
jgi:EAL domain-containing protein (putative c-di-GMP-specific phosphodiesterase class I)